MGGKERIRHYILTFMAALPVYGCHIDECEYVYDDSERQMVILSFGHPEMKTRASTPDEDIIHDLNLAIIEDGIVEELIWKDKIDSSNDMMVTLDLRKGRRYTFLSIVNLGKKLETSELENIEDIYYEIEEDGGFSNGIPMSGIKENILIDKDQEIHIDLIRLAAKISIGIDRSRLSAGIDMSVKSVRIGNCPKYVSVIGPSKVSSVYDRLESGFELSSEQCVPLNISGKGGISDFVSLYILENMQGKFPYEICEDEEKVLGKDDSRHSLASFVELEIYYKSSELISYDSNLKYRFFLGEGLNDLNVERNCHYHITVCPEDDGLSGGGWRVDKSGIGPSTPVFAMLPGEFVQGHVGDTIRVWCECYPRTAPFDPGYEELNYDKSRGIYDYSVDEDKHGVTLYLKKPGTGIVYMTAGQPINQSGMVLVSVLP